MKSVARNWGILAFVAAVAIAVAMISGGRIPFGGLCRRHLRIPPSLSFDFYSSECPHVERIIRSAVAEAFSVDPTIAPALLRLVFHDCFIQGCDASILLDAVNGNRSEKDARPNLTVRGYETIDSIKSKLEEVCPAIVSCADIIVLAAREAVTQAGGPFYHLRTGRRDGLRPYFREASMELPSPFESLNRTLTSFAAKGFDDRDIVALFGAHGVGRVDCREIQDRLHNFRGSGSPDPSVKADFSRRLQERCNGREAIALAGEEMEDDRRSSTFFHADYYRGVLNGQALLHADQQLMASRRTASLVAHYASDEGSDFRRDFARAMMKLSSLGVLSGEQGQVRLKCSSILTSSS